MNTSLWNTGDGVFPGGQTATLERTGATPRIVVAPHHAATGSWGQRLMARQGFLVQRFFEVLPGAVTIFLVSAIFWGSWLFPTPVALAIIAFDLYWFTRSFSASYHAIQGYTAMRKAERTNWRAEYEKALDDAGIGGLRVSVLVSLGSVLVTLLVAIPAAYALSRLRSRAVSIALILLLLAQMIPSVVLATSFYAMFNSWGLLNTFIGLILANSTAGVPFAVIVMRAFMLRLDAEEIGRAHV